MTEVRWQFDFRVPTEEEMSRGITDLQRRWL
jgi:hypothetical protein